MFEIIGLVVFILVASFIGLYLLKGVWWATGINIMCLLHYVDVFRGKCEGESKGKTLLYLLVTPLAWLEAFITYYIDLFSFYEVSGCSVGRWKFNGKTISMEKSCE